MAAVGDLEFRRGDAMREKLLTLDGAVEHDPAIDAWFEARVGSWGRWRGGGLR